MGTANVYESIQKARNERKIKLTDKLVYINAIKIHYLSTERLMDNDRVLINERVLVIGNEIKRKKILNERKTEAVESSKS